MILHRTRSQGFSGLVPITLESIKTFLDFWPQWDELKFVEIILVADQTMTTLFAEDSEKKTTPKETTDAG
jgi:hypothetical protein